MSYSSCSTILLYVVEHLIYTFFGDLEKGGGECCVLQEIKNHKLGTGT